MYAGVRERVSEFVSECVRKGGGLRADGGGSASFFGVPSFEFGREQPAEKATSNARTEAQKTIYDKGKEGEGNTKLRLIVCHR